MNRVIQIRSNKSHPGFENLSADASFTSLLKSHCEQNGRLRYDAVATAAHLDAAYVYRLIKGEKCHPSSNTVIRLALALRLSVAQTDELLMAAGYAPLVLPSKIY